MASPAYINTIVSGLAADIKKAFVLVGEYVLGNLRLGRPGHQVRSENLQAYFVEGTTHAVANTEFSIEHGLATAPYLAVPVLDLQAVGSKLVPLEVTQAADARRIYLKSSETSKAVTLLLE